MRDVLAGAEEDLWNYSLEVMSGIGDYIRARDGEGHRARTRWATARSH